MKEVTAVVRREKARATGEALEKAGFAQMLTCDVKGRGMECGLRYSTGKGEEDKAGIRFLPKKMFTLFVEGKDLEEVVDIIMKENRTGEIGDGKIFISPIEVERGEG